jgi:hypothetical protein
VQTHPCDGVGRCFRPDEELELLELDEELLLEKLLLELDEDDELELRGEELLDELEERGDPDEEDDIELLLDDD